MVTKNIGSNMPINLATLPVEGITLRKYVCYRDMSDKTSEVYVTIYVKRSKGEPKLPKKEIAKQEKKKEKEAKKQTKTDEKKQATERAKEEKMAKIRAKEEEKMAKIRAKEEEKMAKARR